MSRKIEYGVVAIVGGEHKGELGYYEDDDSDTGKAIVYLGTALFSDYILKDRRQLRPATPEQQAEFESKHMSNEVYRANLEKDVARLRRRSEMHRRRTDLRKPSQ